MGKNVKKRNWAFILYPESAPNDWIDQLIQMGLSGAVSPLHDKDINPDGSEKKAHYHVIICYSGPTTYNVVKGITDSLNQPAPKAVESIRGYYRYLTHKDNPEKAPYSEDDIKSFGGFNISDYVELTKSEVNSIIKKIQSFVREVGIYEFCDLLDILLDSDMSDMYDVAVTHTLVINKYIESRRYKRENGSPSEEDKKK